VRLFLAIELPESALRSLVALQDELRPALPGWRWLPASCLHLTLRFLGEVDENADVAQRARWRLAIAGHPALRLELGEVGVLPGRARARVLYAGVTSASPEGALAAIASALEDEARRLGYPPEQRPLRPHVTLARALPRARPGAPRNPALVRAIEARCREVTLFRSELSPRGASYAALERFALGEDGLDPAPRARQHDGAREQGAEVRPAATHRGAEPRS
jgi:2'-5' RNA ligase